MALTPQPVAPRAVVLRPGVGRLAGAAVRRVPVTLSYLATLVVVEIAMGRFAPGTRARLVQLASANLHQLGIGNLSTLLTSGFVIDGSTTPPWWLEVAAMLCAGELVWGGRRLVLTFSPEMSAPVCSSQSAWSSEFVWGGYRSKSPMLPM